MGWVFGFKPHMVIAGKGQVMAVKSMAGNAEDRKPFEAMVAEMEGKMFADRGDISKAIFKRLW